MERNEIKVTIDTAAYGNSFVGNVCQDCQYKLLEAFKKYAGVSKVVMALRAKSIALEMQSLLCPTCRAKVIEDMKGRGLLK